MSKYITLVEGDFVCNIPKGMTNGEVIQALFPNLDNANESSYFSKVRNMEGHFIKTDKEFWNAPYKVESEE